MIPTIFRRALFEKQQNTAEEVIQILVFEVVTRNICPSYGCENRKLRVTGE